jgi:hypothetical protein
MDTRSARRRTRTRTVDLELPAAVRHDASDDRAGAVGAVRGAPRAGVDRAREASRASVQTNFDTCVRIFTLHASRRLPVLYKMRDDSSADGTVHPATLDIDCSYVRTERRTTLEHVNREKSEKTRIVSRARLNAHTTARTKRVAYVFSERGKSELQRQPGARNRALPGARAPRTGPRRDRASPFFPRERPRRGVLWDI